MSNPAATHVARLPRLVSESGTWLLPLNDYAALELARLLLIDERTARAALLARLMSVEPAVTLWAACALSTVERSAPTPPRCVMQLAQRLVAALPELGSWSCDSHSDPSAESAQLARWRNLSADAVAVANLAADLIDDDDLAAEAFLLGLLHNAADWLRSCGPRISPAKAQVGCLPAWLAARVGERARGPRSEPMRSVMQAGRAWRSSGRRVRQVSGVDVSDALWARRRWRPAGYHSDASVSLLADLSQKLQRLGQLERDFQNTLEREKLDALAELAYGASHEINNPLANISTRAQALLVGEPDPERRRMLAVINTQAFRANEMVADMMLFARPPELVRDEVNLADLADTVIEELSDDAVLQGTRLFRPDMHAPLVVCADRTQLTMALRAVVVNSLQALAADGEVQISIEPDAAALDHAPSARLSVRDTGPGIAPHVRRHLFDPFFSGREAGRGLGLGLAKCWRIVALHGGQIEVTSAAGQGTTITMCLPVGDVPRDAAGESPAGQVAESESPPETS